MLQVMAASSAKQLADSRALRVEVFVKEQGVPAANEFDDLDLDPSTVHCVAYEGKRCIATGRLLAPTGDGNPHIGRVAVSAQARGTGAGRLVTEFLELAALEQFGRDGHVRIQLSAQTHAIPFYQSLGYTIDGSEYLEEGIPHRAAYKDFGAN